MRDLQRYLAGEPVEAGPPSTLYRVRKLAARHRLALGVSAALVSVLASATVYSAREAERARRAERVAEAVSNFLQQDVLAQASTASQGGPGTKRDPDIKVRTALDRAAAKVGASFQSQPVVEAAVRRTIAKAYADLGLYQESRNQDERAAALTTTAGAPDGRDTLLARYQICVDDYGLGRYKEGENESRRLLQAARRVLSPSDDLTMNILDILASHLIAAGKFADAEAALKEGIELAHRAGGETHDALHVEETLGGLYRNWGKFQEAEAADSRVLEKARQILGPDHPLTLGVSTELAEDYRLGGKFTDAERLGLEAIEAQKRIHGPDHPETMAAMNNLANVYLQQGEYSKSEPLHRQVAEYNQRTKGPDDADALTPWHNLATDLYAMGRYEEAVEIEKNVFENRIRLLGRDHWLTILASDVVGASYAAEGRLAEAEAIHAESAQIARRTMGLRNPNTLGTLNRLANVYRREGKLDRTEALQAEVLENIKQVLGEDHPTVLTAMGNLALTRHTLHKEQDAVNLAQAAIAKYENRYPNVWTRFRTEAVLGASLAGLKNYDDAEPHLLKGYQGLVDHKRAIPADTLFYIEYAARWTADMYAAWGKPEKATLWQSRAQNAAMPPR